jgi:predicted adenine nucleotide alpha hydrolase (AANH) superfamily ATPase
MKINYDLKLKEELELIGDSKPSLLLHVCCGPCSSNVVKELCEHFNITLYYSNSNIYPSEEYMRRRDELIEFIKQFNNDYNRWRNKTSFIVKQICYLFPNIFF